MSKVVITADLHFRLVDTWGIIQDGINSRLSDKIKSCQKIINYTIESKASALLILGDIFDKINPAEKLRRIFAETVINPLLKENIPIIILAGNHDTNYDVFSFETEASILKSISDTYIELITEPTILNLLGRDCYFIPYGYEIPTDNSGCELAFAHHGIKGAETGVGVIQRGGEEIERTDFRVFRKTFSGHYHKPQELYFEDSEFVYVSSVNIWDIGERLDKKRFIELDLDTLEWSSILIPDRQFYRFTYIEGDNFEFVEDIKDAVVEVILEGSKQWLKTLSLTDIKKAFQKFEPHKIVVKVKASKEERIVDFKISDTENERDIINRFAKEQKIDAELLGVGLEVYESV